jgi:hypothetical protein
VCAISTARGQDPATTSVSPIVRVTLQLDSSSTAQFIARGFELRVARSDAPPSAPTTEIQLMKRAGPHTGALVSLGATGTHAPAGAIEVLDSLGQPTLTLRVSDVEIVSDHLTLSGSRATLEQQRLAQQEALSALTTDYQEAQRQLAAEEELSKVRGNARMDLARARDRASDLARRIELLKQRQQLLASQEAGQSPLEETIVLRFGKLQIESGEPGGSATIDLGGGTRTACATAATNETRSSGRRECRNR